MTFENHQYYNCEIQLDNDKVYHVAANWIHNSRLDNWMGWSCDAGHKRIEIDADFNVKSGMCQNDHLGNIFEGWALLDSPTICRQNSCTGCTDDLIIGKRKLPSEVKDDNY